MYGQERKNERTGREADAARPAPKPAARYLQHRAATCGSAIADGRYPVGAQLPTEHELCRQLGLSRFTIREAIRVLATAGLVRRKPRAGTVVAAAARRHALQPRHQARCAISSSTRRATHFHYVYVGRVGLSTPQARTLSARAPARSGSTRSRCGADRAARSRSAVTRLFLNPALKGIEKRAARLGATPVLLR